jgi:hypothetical protein
VGSAKIRRTPTEALADGQFLLSTTGGRDTFEVVESLAPHPRAGARRSRASPGPDCLPDRHVTLRPLPEP